MKLNKIAQHLVLGMKVTTERTKMQGQVKEIRYYQGEKYALIEWPKFSSEKSGWYNQEQADNLLIC